MIKKYVSIFSLLLFGVFLHPLVACGPNEPGVVYHNFPTDPQYPSTFVTGIRRVAGSTDVYISGGYTVNGVSTALLYQGPLFIDQGNLNSEAGTWNLFQPSATLAPGQTIVSSNLYGPDNSSRSGEVNAVGTYQIQGDNKTYGFFYSGPPNASGTTWLNLLPTSLVAGGDILAGTVPHSTMNGVAVGNFDTQLRSGRVFIYNTANSTYYELTKSGTTSISAYGIWWNGGTSYTIAGGYHDPLLATEGEVAYLVDWDSSTQQATNWQAYNFLDQTNQVTHFEGIDGGEGQYHLVASWTTVGGASDGATGAGYALVQRTSTGAFGPANWAEVIFPGASTTTGNTVYLNNVLGVYLLSGSATTYPYVAVVNDTN